MRGLACGTLKSRTLGSGTGLQILAEAGAGDRSATSCSSSFFFFSKFARLAFQRGFLRVGLGFSAGTVRRQTSARSHSPSRKFVRNNMPIKPSVA